MNIIFLVTMKLYSFFDLHYRERTAKMIETTQMRE